MSIRSMLPSMPKFLSRPKLPSRPNLPSMRRFMGISPNAGSNRTKSDESVCSQNFHSPLLAIEDGSVEEPVVQDNIANIAMNRILDIQEVIDSKITKLNNDIEREYGKQNGDNLVVNQLFDQLELFSGISKKMHSKLGQLDKLNNVDEQESSAEKLKSTLKEFEDDLKLVTDTTIHFRLMSLPTQPSPGLAIEYISLQKMDQILDIQSKAINKASQINKSGEPQTKDIENALESIDTYVNFALDLISSNSFTDDTLDFVLSVLDHCNKQFNILGKLDDETHLRKF